MALIQKLLALVNHWGMDTSLLPFKAVGIVTISGKRHRLKFALRHDLDWDNYLAQSWRKKAYWYHRSGTRQVGRIQLMDMVLEWRIGKLNGKS